MVARNNMHTEETKERIFISEFLSVYSLYLVFTGISQFPCFQVLYIKPTFRVFVLLHSCMQFNMPQQVPHVGTSMCSNKRTNTLFPLILFILVGENHSGKINIQEKERERERERERETETNW